MGDGFAAGLFDLADDVAGRPACAAGAVAAHARVIHHHRGALAGQFQAVCAADATPAAGDKDDASVEGGH